MLLILGVVVVAFVLLVYAFGWFLCRAAALAEEAALQAFESDSPPQSEEPPAHRFAG
jgi:hypothetical protein